MHDVFLKSNGILSFANMSMYRVSLNSTKLVSGAWNDGMFNISLPVPLSKDDISKDWTICVESLVFNSAVAIPFYVTAPTLNVQPTFVSGNFLNVLFFGNQTTFTRSITSNLVDTPLHDIISLASSSIHRLQFVDTTGAIFTNNGATGMSWVMNLVIFSKC